MKTKALLFGLFTLGLFSLGTLITVIFNTTPTTRDVVWLFYVTLWLSIFSLVFFSFFITNYARNGAIPPWQSTIAAFRYGVVTATLVSVLLALNANQLLSIPTLVVVIVLTGLGELLWRRRGATSL